MVRTATKTRPGDWLPHFENHRKGWSEPDWQNLSPDKLDTEKRILLRESLAIFQLGESGGGSRLRRFVRQVVANGEDGIDVRYERAVELFLAEENEHARLLAELIGYLDGRLKQRHWANGVFRRVRAVLGLKFNLQALLTAELIAEAYYGLLYQNVSDPVVKKVCARIVRDEVGHIGFHRTFFGWLHRGKLPGATAIWGAQFQLLFLVAERVVWRDHGPCLRAFGVDREGFARRSRTVCRRFLLGVKEASCQEYSGIFRGNDELVAEGESD